MRPSNLVRAVRTYLISSNKLSMTRMQLRGLGSAVNVLGARQIKPILAWAATIGSAAIAKFGHEAEARLTSADARLDLLAVAG